MARERGFVQLDPLARFGKQKRDTYYVAAACFAITALLMFLVFSFFFLFSVVPFRAPPCIRRDSEVDAFSFARPAGVQGRSCECGGDQSPLWVPRVLLLVVPTAWVRLGAQPDGPIPRFALTIPDPDDPPLVGEEREGGGVLGITSQKVPGGLDSSLTRAVQYVHV